MLSRSIFVCCRLATLTTEHQGSSWIKAPVAGFVSRCCVLSGIPPLAGTYQLAKGINCIRMGSAYGYKVKANQEVEFHTQWKIH